LYTEDHQVKSGEDDVGHIAGGNRETDPGDRQQSEAHHHPEFDRRFGFDRGLSGWMHLEVHAAPTPPCFPDCLFVPEQNRSHSAKSEDKPNEDCAEVAHEAPLGYSPISSMR
jgi:hypothetical protein